MFALPNTARLPRWGCKCGDERFWEEDDGILGGHLWSRSPQLGEFSYPSNDYFSPKGVLLGLYGDGHLAGLAEQTVSARVEHVLARLS